MLNIQLNKTTKIMTCIKLFPPFYLLHDIEEIWTVEVFLVKHSDRIPFFITTEEFTFAFLLLWMIAAIGCYQATRQKSILGMGSVTFIAFLVPGLLLANGVGHVVQFLFFQEYVPGIITSLLIIFPYSLLVLRYLLQEHLLTMKKFFLFFVLGFILQVPLAAIALLISTNVFR